MGFLPFYVRETRKTLATKKLMAEYTVVIDVPVKHLDVKFSAAYGAAVKKLRKLYVYTCATYTGVEEKTLADHYHFYSYSFTLEGMGYKIK